jgi:hypothetical protein
VFNNKVVSIYDLGKKEAGLAYFKVSYQIFLGGMEGNYGNLPQGG